MKYKDKLDFEWGLYIALQIVIVVMIAILLGAVTSLFLYGLIYGGVR